MLQKCVLEHLRALLFTISTFYFMAQWFFLKEELGFYEEKSKKISADILLYLVVLNHIWVNNRFFVMAFNYRKT